MFLEVFSNQAVAASGTVYSQAFEIGDDNALFVSVFAVSGTSGTNLLTLTGEASNDLTNWVSTGVTGSVVVNATAPAAGGGNLTAIAARYIRIKAAAGTVATITFNASVNSKQL